jgi:hypothetical protein
VSVYFLFFSPAGWEVLYDLLNHCVGVDNMFSGVQMHLSHFRGHVNKRITALNPNVRGFFEPSDWRVFAQSGLACRLLGFPSSIRDPCCSLRYIGGDGTAIGIPTVNAAHLSPIWEPPSGTRPPRKKWGRLHRCVIGHNIQDSVASEKKQAREFIRESTSGAMNTENIADIRENFDEHIDTMPDDLRNLLELWFSFDTADPKWDPVRRLLRVCACQDSACGIVTCAMVPFIDAAVGIATKQSPFTLLSDLNEWKRLLIEISKQGMGPDIAKALEAAKNDYLQSPVDGKPALIALSAFLTYIGAFPIFSKISFCLHVNASSKFFCFPILDSYWD